MLYIVVLVSAVQQHESAICVYRSPPSGAPPPSPHVLYLFPLLLAVFHRNNLERTGKHNCAGGEGNK